jgi:hypothetical protein
MSYFMAVNGEKPDLTGLDPISASSADEGQWYVPKCANDFRKLGLTGDFWFIDDGYTDTSDEFVEEGVSVAWSRGTFRQTLFYQVLERCEMAGNSIFLWYGNHNSHLHLTKLTKFEEILELIEGEAKPFQTPTFFYLNPKRIKE